jgi:holo-[acyl-carrier protein] synthase
MILGIGQDSCEIPRIEKTLVRFGERFENRVFTDIERAKAKRRAEAGVKMVAGTYAKRFAAKEACSKALGTGLSHGVFWRDMEVINLPTGQPTLKLTGGALARLHSMIPDGHQANIQLSLTDDYPTAQALVIIEAIPEG